MLYQITSLLLEVAAGLIAGTCLLRLYMQYQRIPMSVRSGNPLAKFIFALTDWLVLPLRRVLPAMGHWDTASLVGAYLLEACTPRAGDMALALTLLREVHANRATSLGDGHPDSLLATGDLAVCLSRTGHTKEAEALQGEMPAMPEALEALTHIGQARTGRTEVGRVYLGQIAQAHHLGTFAGTGDDGLHLVRSQVLALVDQDE